MALSMSQRWGLGGQLGLGSARRDGRLGGAPARTSRVKRAGEGARLLCPECVEVQGGEGLRSARVGGIRALSGHGADRRGVGGADTLRQGAGAPDRRDARHRALRRPRRAGARRGTGRAAGRPGGQRRARPDLRCRQLRRGRDARPGAYPARADGGPVRHRRLRRDARRLAECPGRPGRGGLRPAGDDVDARLLQPRRDPRVAGRRGLRLGGRRARSRRWPPVGFTGALIDGTAGSLAPPRTRQARTRQLGARRRGPNEPGNPGQAYWPKVPLDRT